MSDTSETDNELNFGLRESYFFDGDTDDDLQSKRGSSQISSHKHQHKHNINSFNKYMLHKSNSSHSHSLNKSIISQTSPMSISHSSNSEDIIKINYNISHNKDDNSSKSCIISPISLSNELDMNKYKKNKNKKKQKHKKSKNKDKKRKKKKKHKRKSSKNKEYNNNSDSLEVGSMNSSEIERINDRISPMDNSDDDIDDDIGDNGGNNEVNNVNNDDNDENHDITHLNYDSLNAHNKIIAQQLIEKEIEQQQKKLEWLKQERKKIQSIPNEGRIKKKAQSTGNMSEFQALAQSHVNAKLLNKKKVKKNKKKKKKKNHRSNTNIDDVDFNALKNELKEEVRRRSSADFGMNERRKEKRKRKKDRKRKKESSKKRKSEIKIITHSHSHSHSSKSQAINDYLSTINRSNNILVNKIELNTNENNINHSTNNTIDDDIGNLSPLLIKQSFQEIIKGNNNDSTTDEDIRDYNNINIRNNIKKNRDRDRDRERKNNKKKYIQNELNKIKNINILNTRKEHKLNKDELIKKLKKASNNEYNGLISLKNYQNRSKKIHGLRKEIPPPPISYIINPHNDIPPPPSL